MFFSAIIFTGDTGGWHYLFFSQKGKSLYCLCGFFSPVLPYILPFQIMVIQIEVALPFNVPLTLE